MGMLKQSQKRTKRAALMDASISKQPARTIGWLATTPMVDPSMRPKQMTMLAANPGCNSKKSPSSTTFSISSFMS